MKYRFYFAILRNTILVSYLSRNCKAIRVVLTYEKKRHSFLCGNIRPALPTNFSSVYVNWNTLRENFYRATYRTYYVCVSKTRYVTVGTRSNFASSFMLLLTQHNVLIRVWHLTNQHIKMRCVNSALQQQRTRLHLPTKWREITCTCIHIDSAALLLCYVYVRKHRSMFLVKFSLCSSYARVVSYLIHTQAHIYIHTHTLVYIFRYSIR